MRMIESLNIEIKLCNDTNTSGNRETTYPNIGKWIIPDADQRNQSCIVVYIKVKYI